jgi:hypothetical protein
MSRFVTPAGVEIELSDEAGRRVGYTRVEKAEKPEQKPQRKPRQAKTADKSE